MSLFQKESIYLFYYLFIYLFYLFILLLFISTSNNNLRELLELPHVRQLQEARAARRGGGLETGRSQFRAVYTAFRDFRALGLDSQRPKAMPTVYLQVQIDLQIARSDQIVGPHLGVDLSSKETLSSK